MVYVQFTHIYTSANAGVNVIFTLHLNTVGYLLVIKILLIKIN
jgi:hypothetical protein